MVNIYNSTVIEWIKNLSIDDSIDIFNKLTEEERSNVGHKAVEFFYDRSIFQLYDLNYASPTVKDGNIINLVATVTLYPEKVVPYFRAKGTTTQK